MTHLVLPSCIKCKYTDCVEVCPVDCFHEGENMLVIDPEVCIDCGVCIPECPIDAIVHCESDVDDPEKRKWMSFNAKAVNELKWPSIIERKSPPPDADDYATKSGDEKEHLLSLLPGGEDT